MQEEHGLDDDEIKKRNQYQLLLNLLHLMLSAVLHDYNQDLL